MRFRDPLEVIRHFFPAVEEQLTEDERTLLYCVFDFEYLELEWDGAVIRLVDTLNGDVFNSMTLDEWSGINEEV